MLKAELKQVLKSKVVWVASLGYFVDIYDLVLFGIVRVPSLQSLGLSPGVANDNLLRVGAHLLNWQMAGMLLGGFTWGVLGDRFGRIKALYGSILLYSIANLLNAFVQDTSQYAFLRFIAGMGLAGELGAAIALVAETLPTSQRGLGAAIVGLCGFLGAVFSALLGGQFDWRVSYFLGGVLGLILLFIRIRTGESSVFLKYSQSKFKITQHFSALFLDRKKLSLYFRCVAVGAPIWYVAGILMYFSPEIAMHLNISGPIAAGQAILFGYAGSIVGDPLAGFLSHRMKSRKWCLFTFLVFAILSNIAFFYFLRGATPSLYYFFCFLLGITNGYWTLFVTMSAEQFGTRLRATVSTSVPNIVRSLVIPMTFLFLYFKSVGNSLMGAFLIGIFAGAISLLALLSLRDTYDISLDYAE